MIPFEILRGGGLETKNKMWGGGLPGFFQSVSPEDLKWNSPNEIRHDFIKLFNISISTLEKRQ